VTAFGDQVRGYVIVEPPGDHASLVDQQGHARAACGDDAPFAIRPDNYVGLVLADPEPESEPVMDYLQRITARRRPIERLPIEAADHHALMPAARLSYRISPRGIGFSGLW
jgi:hypothetical protein